MYAFRPLTAVTVNASLCESAFDTKLMLYKEGSSSSTAPTLVSCNDDACGSQSWLQVISGFCLLIRFCRLVTPELRGQVIQGCMLDDTHAVVYKQSTPTLLLVLLVPDTVTCAFMCAGRKSTENISTTHTSLCVFAGLHTHQNVCMSDAA